MRAADHATAIVVAGWIVAAAIMAAILAMLLGWF